MNPSRQESLTQALTARRKSHHQHRVEEFMLRAGQEVPVLVKVPDEDVRKLRARLILEEALETIDGLGFNVKVQPGELVGYQKVMEIQDVRFAPHRHGPDIIEVLDGCADIKVVTTGTLSAFGVPDEALQELIDDANLQKFSVGGHLREDGKWVKPRDWQPPDILALLVQLGLLDEPAD